MNKRSLNGTQFANIVLGGADSLHRHAEYVNTLNVFPVPDGDTGTNMNLTMTAGITEMKAKMSTSIAKTAEVLSKGLLMGARGNSGVILSQLFRGFSRGVAGHDEVNSVQFAHAMQSGVETAYKAVVKPVEGTILTVAKETAKHAVHIARRTPDLVDFMREVVAKANEALKKTQDMLPVLKQVGVVDSGGQGLVYIYEGFLSVLESEDGVFDETAVPAAAPAQAKQPAAPALEAPISAQAKLNTEDIEFLYDMEFFIDRSRNGSNAKPFNEDFFRKALAKNGDSIIVIPDDDIIKVHVHSRKPGEVLDLAMGYGELIRICILNMREQHRELIQGEHGEVSAMPEVFADIPAPAMSAETLPVEPPADEIAPYGFIAVAMGQGIGDIFNSLGVDVVLSGGQTMNPSTQDFIDAIETISAQHIYILPNNSNIVMAAKQAAEIVERGVTVIPSKTIPQGIAAAFAFQEDESLEVNTTAMEAAISHIISGQVTYAVRDTTLDGLDIKAGHYMGIANGKIIATTDSVNDTLQQLLTKMLADGGEVVTLLTGEEAREEDTETLIAWLNEEYPEAEVEVHQGGQPIYSYIVSVE
ncbi:DAK2 domain-containing protein [Paenibacillus apiarius]|uniref:DAK2 domain-containing protein n=1 Tax=Paenibacillus apiarius TaxID=46240 RepID=A0ABT4DLM8_9BACL|nr:DAK2 domain-containing protein [Paenibacillus apiarius]MCY9513708.1 DAK2 domain-containing protein [Paenibacillus apiarius]MCY9518259.1 DAK2 domain-containing protein [Paenibacillus apiarius]MCY9551340.1 DAK2 domain-containing protein [Paenibacillus apiarius]MCY9558494.1 DAK2 domain-containing protein [Paenibacillus apiarius]MCY9684192.1 DAK2 domain-containing protein [Paenibacillus apiarius]